MAEENLQKSEAALREEEILTFWKAQDIFKKTLAKESPKGEFVFYEGPPTANGRPGIHHIEARAFKDIIPRFRTMQGYHVRRKGGWDTHGLPVELEVEKQLDLHSKKDIEKYGIAAFNQKCKESVWKYVDEWYQFTDRMGYWVDVDDAYVTYDPKYIESLWSVVGHIHKRQLLYKDYKVVPWCPRCGTALSSHELAQGYKDITDLSVYVKFQRKDDEKSFILAWTTTPWTLPGNVALAVGSDIDYVEVAMKENGEKYILARARLSILLEDSYTIISTMKGADLVGLEYLPLYPFFSQSENLPESEREKMQAAYQIYDASFVTTDDGTGVVHTAVMYGQDDFDLGTKIGLPKYHLVTDEGLFKEEVTPFAGMFVRSEDTAVAVIKDLAHRNLLLKKEKYTHSYPHCWRCKTALIYYARDSWYVRMSALRDELVSENEKINWEPSYIKEGRFGEWLREVKDWAISRERYWGTPLPVWLSADQKELLLVDSLETLKQYTQKSGNKYFVMRHGEAESNLKKILSSKKEDTNSLTEKGKNDIEKAAETLKEKKITKVISSPLTRAVETSKIVIQKLGLPQEALIVDDNLIETNGGVFSGKTIAEYHAFFSSTEERFTKTPEGGENWTQVKDRMSKTLYDLEEKYQGENILIVSHSGPLSMLQAGAQGLDVQEAAALHQSQVTELQPGEVRQIGFVPLPHNEHFELDLHRPYIDDVVLISQSGKEMRRVKEVMDVWFDSGAMPFAQDHYPFENKEWVEGAGYPADYISEAIDQTRGWFYTLHAVGVLMERGRAYKNVICLGHILDSQGKKMSKSVGNVVNPWEMIDKYGVDPLRFWMYSVNQPGESKNFDLKTVEETNRKVFGLLDNVLKFYELYATEEKATAIQSNHALDRWIMARLNQLVAEVTDGLENYQVLEAARPIRDFIADLSQWYIRRSRDRFKSDDEQDRACALATTKEVLLTLSKLFAPFAPFTAEEMYRKLKSSADPESVHLALWPESGSADENVLTGMADVRTTVSQALELRAKANIKVRQPLARLTIAKDFAPEYKDIIADELNVKEIIVDSSVDHLVLDTHLTLELAEEGTMRELLRQVQELRKNTGLQASDQAVLTVSTSPEGKALITKYQSLLQKTANLRTIAFAQVDAPPIVIDGASFSLSLAKQ